MLSFLIYCLIASSIYAIEQFVIVHSIVSFGRSSLPLHLACAADSSTNLFAYHFDIVFRYDCLTNTALAVSYLPPFEVAYSKEG